MSSRVVSRRAVLQAGAAASSVTYLATAAWSAEPFGPRTLGFYKVLFDRDQPAARAFGQAATDFGTPTQAIGRDITALWYDDLYHRWREQPIAIAGMTPLKVAFCLQMLAQDAGMRVLYRAEHVNCRDGRLTHRLSGPRALLNRAQVLDAGSDWPRGAAQLVVHCPAERCSRSTLALRATPPAGDSISEPLVSWVLAPRTRA